MGGIRSDLCDDIAFNIWQWPAEQQIWVSAAHIPGSENVVADKSSRTFERSSEWKLRERVFKHIFFFHLDFLSRTFTIHGTAGEGGMGGGGIYLTPLYHFHPLHRHLDISRAITAESSPLHIAGSRT